VAARAPDDTRTRILSAAGKLFYRDGIRPVAMDAVAEAAGVTKRTLYYHFDSKDDLVIAYLKLMGERAEASLTKTTGAVEGGPAERVLSVFEGLRALFSRGEPFRGCPFINVAAELAESEPTRLVAASYKERMRAWYEIQLIELGVDDPAGLSEQLMILADGAITTWLVRRDPQAAVRARDAAAILLETARQQGETTP
jgi:AcrR family transcriptional regulator